MAIRLLLAWVLLSFIACSDSHENHPVFKYFPSERVFEQGYVNKFYFHYYPDNTGQRPYTKLVYSKCQKVANNEFIATDYNAGFEMESYKRYVVDGSIVTLVEAFDIDPRTLDTFNIEVLNGVVSQWDGSWDKPYQVRFANGSDQFIYSQNQLALTDSTMEGRSAKVFTTEWNYTNVGEDTIVSEGKEHTFYVEDMGFFGGSSDFDGYNRQFELIEQMPLEEFEKRASHGEHRVAWIDPQESMSDDSDFELCGREKAIADYYNSTPQGTYLHNKRAMLDTIFSNLDKSRLTNESGRLVFRFVVNCEGRAGRFIVRGYDLDYQPKEFSHDAVEHLFGLLQKLQEWRHVVIREEPRDAYFYITFNIENGEIVDILP